MPAKPHPETLVIKPRWINCASSLIKGFPFSSSIGLQLAVLAMPVSALGQGIRSWHQPLDAKLKSGNLLLRFQKPIDQKHTHGWETKELISNPLSLTGTQSPPPDTEIGAFIAPLKWDRDLQKGEPSEEKNNNKSSNIKPKPRMPKPHTAPMEAQTQRKPPHPQPAPSSPRMSAARRAAPLR